MNAHWLGPDLVRTNQPSPRQLAYWKAQGIRTVINLRGARDEAYYALEKEACERLGLTLIDAPLDSRDPPETDRIHRARRLFTTIEYPVLIHCKHGQNRTGLIAAMYRIVYQGWSRQQAIDEMREGGFGGRERFEDAERYLQQVDLVRFRAALDSGACSTSPWAYCVLKEKVFQALNE